MFFEVLIKHILSLKNCNTICKKKKKKKKYKKKEIFVELILPNLECNLEDIFAQNILYFNKVVYN